MRIKNISDNIETNLNLRSKNRMNDWFTIEKIDECTYAISEYKHWEETHSYLLIGNGESLLIDSGMGIGNILNEVNKLTKNPVTVVSTHTHWDHIGGHKLFDHFFVHEDEEIWINGAFPLPLDYIKTLVIEEPCEIPKDFNVECYQIFQGTADRILKDHDMIEFGGRKLEVLHTPGHSPGHMCFYESQTGYLFTGDLIYEGKMIAFFPTSDPAQYKESVDKLSTLPVKRLLPAHHKLDIETELLTKVQSAFNEIKDNGNLRHCGQIFEFDGFQIQL